MAIFTAGLLRHFHDLTPTSPFLGPAVGSLLFACIFFLVLVAVRERQIGAAPGPGVRLGSVTPLLLMLLVEKWISSAFYQPAFVLLAPAELPEDVADAWFRLLCGLSLLAIVALSSRFSWPARAFVRARLTARKAFVGICVAAVSIAGVWLPLTVAAWALGSSVGVASPHPAGPILVVLAGQAAIALAEEAYYRGLILGELLRLAPRLGLHAPALRRWVALGLASLLFGMEHLGIAGGDGAVRQLVFALALGALFGMIVLLTENLWFAAALHAWINWLLLSAVPQITFGPAKSGLPAGASISLALIGAFVAAFVMQRRASRAA